MASNPPPFQVEDNTDDDFFDKLVDDDDDGGDLKVAATSSVLPNSVFTDGNESDEVKAFANLSINDLYNTDEIKCDATSNSKHDLNLEIENDGQNGKVGTFEASGYPLVPLHTLDFDNLICEAENENGAAEVLSVVSKSSSEGLSETTMVSKSSARSAAAGVKEVEWSAFHADSAGNDSNGFGSYSDFFSEIGGHNVGETLGNEGDGLNNGPTVAIGNEVHGSAGVENSIAFKQYNEEAYNYGEVADQTTDVQDLIRSQYWEDLYPGWKYDTNTEQWYQVDGRDTGAFVQANADSNLSSNWGVSDRKPDFSYLQKTAHSVIGTLTEIGSTENITNLNQASQVSEAMESTANWNQVSQVSGDTFGFTTESSQASQVNNGYPPHVVFDPQYPGWCYDTIAQEWRTLESYNASAQSTSQVQDGRYWDGYASVDTFAPNNDQKAGITQSQVISQAQGFISQLQDHISARSSSNYNLQNSSLWHPQTVSKSEAAAQFGGNQPIENHYGPDFAVSARGIQQNSVHYGGTISCYENVNQGQNDLSMPSISQGYVVGGNLSQQFNDSRFNQNDYKHSNDYHNNQNSVYFSQQQIQSAQTSCAPAAGRSSAGRPPHALVAFGFGGKLIVMKGNSSVENLNFGSQNPVGGTMSVLNLAEVANDKVDASNHGMGVCNYFQALCWQSLPGPLIGGSVGNKELNKWIDERIAQLESTGVDYTKGQVFRLLFSLLKIACQYYGKLRSPYGTDAVLKENDAPESAVAKLFASVKKDGMQFSQYDVTAQCLHQIPSEGQMRVTAIEVQNLLVSGRKREALQHAQEGQLWGPALVLAAELGDQFYVETVKKMALHQLVAGSPLRTLCLLIAGQPADVFLADVAAISNMSGTVDMPHLPSQSGANGMLVGWEDNLAVITANRTKDDELVLIHLGDCLWKDRSDIIAAHICYLVAEASFEPYSDSARLCLVGADHWKFPRTYATPESIQKTEIYEYAKTLGNSQFVLLPFQPYKLVYAHMLAEVGRVPDALKYCQAVLKSLKTGRTPEVETLKNLASSLEERIKIYQQGGFSTNLAPKKLVGKLLNLFDSTAHRVVGGIPPQVPTEGGTIHGNEPHHQSVGPRVSTSQSTMAMSSLVPSQSMEPVSAWAADGNRRVMHARSVSEPDFSRSPIQADSLKEATSTGEQEKTSAAGGASRFGRFGFGSQLLQKTVGLVLKPRQGRQAKLGETNKFYYDEKLKRWVEEGAKPPAEEAALPPPPMTAGFQNGTSDNDLKSASRREASLNNGSPEFRSTSTVDNNSRMPPLPPTSNQYSARGRMGVRSRYVDTFNQGGGNQTNLFQSPSVPSIKPAGGANPKFFVPTTAFSVEQPVNAIVNNTQDTSTTYENPSTSPLYDSFQSPASTSSMTLQRFASLNNISDQGLESGNGSFSAHSRRTASWSGSFNDPFGSSHKGEVKPMRKISSMHPSSFMPSDHPSLVQSPINCGSIADELHEVEL